MSKEIFPAEILPHHKAFLGKTGSGKTSTAKLLIEQVVKNDNARVCVLDTVKSDWWGLISSADGKKPGLPFVVLGGPRGHVPLHSSAGRAIGELVASGQLRHSVIDMADFEPGGAQRFFVDFAPTLLRHMKGVLYLVIEEAHELAPKERSGFDKENMAVHYAKKLATAGRSKGIRLAVLTQRTQSLHNALLGSCEVLVAHRLTAPADQEPVIKWLKANTEKNIAESISQQLSQLRTGSAWMVSGEAKTFKAVSFPRISTYDNTATPDDDSHAHEVASAQVDPEQLKALIGEAVKVAEQEDPKALRTEIARLKTELAKAKLAGERAPIHDAGALASAGATGRLAGRDDVFSRLVYPARLAVDAAMGKLDDVRQLLHVPLDPITPPGVTFGQSVVARPEVRAAQQAKNLQMRKAVDAVGIPEGELKILKAVAMYDQGVERDQLSVLTGYKRSTRDAYIQRLFAKGWLAINGPGGLCATEAGIEALGANYEPLPTGAALRAYWLDRLPEGEAKVFSAVLDAHPSAIDRGELSAQTGYKRSTRDAYIQRLAARRIVETDSEGVKAAAGLF